MVNSKYALRDKRREKNAKANLPAQSDPAASASLSISSTVPDKALSSLYLSDFYTEKDPQYHHSHCEVHTKKMTKSKSKKTKAASFRKNKTAPSALPPPSSYHAASAANGATQIRHPGANDVLSGRGGNINNHAGNRAFRSFVNERKYDYNLTKNKSEKAKISQSIVDRVHNLVPPGRFLIKEDGFWREVDGAKAMAKTSQALREGAPSLRAEASANAVKAVKGVAKKTAKSLSSLGKRKRESSRRKRATRSDSQSSNETSDVKMNEPEPEPPHPLIVPMANGHRGKELIPRQTVRDDIKESLHTLKSVSFDEDHEPVLPTKAYNTDTRIMKPKTDVQEDLQSMPSNEGCPLTTALSALPGNSHSTSGLGPCTSPGIIPGSAFASDLYTLPPLSNAARSNSTLYNNTTLPPLTSRPVSGFTRMHSLMSNEFNNSFNGSFHGDETFVNPFLNESRSIADLCAKGDSNDNNIDTATFSSLVGDDAKSSQVSVGSAKPNHKNIESEFTSKDAGSEW